MSAGITVKSAGAGLLVPLRQLFNLSTFRPHQEQVIRAILGGRDVCAVLPTGAGKSLCYQLPSCLMSGVAVVISPLIALMKDQVEGARSRGIAAACLNSSLSPGEKCEILHQLKNAKTALLYIAPERLAMKSFLDVIRSLSISLFAVDEAHCMLEWGDEFRPDYLSLSLIRENFPRVPIAAFTATATPEMAREISRRLSMRSPLMVRASFNRKNLVYRVVEKNDINSQIAALLGKSGDSATIIYRATRKSVMNTWSFLKAAGLQACPYHAGLTSRERSLGQDYFMTAPAPVMVATIAFGMGIDRPDVRLVIHGDLPRSLEQYYQETGRAGRDGLSSECTLFFSRGDVARLHYFINRLENDDLRWHCRERLNAMVAFASGTECRRRLLLRYFSESCEELECGACDNCLGRKEMRVIERPGKKAGWKKILKDMVAGVQGDSPPQYETNL